VLAEPGGHTAYFSPFQKIFGIFVLKLHIQVYSDALFDNVVQPKGHYRLDFIYGAEVLCTVGISPLVSVSVPDRRRIQVAHLGANPCPFSLFPLFPSLPFPCPQMHLEGLGEHCKFSHRGLQNHFSIF